MRAHTALQSFVLPYGWQLHYQASAHSSNDLAFACLRDEGVCAEGVCFRVGEQTKGRGRRGKNWISLPGDGLYLSVVLCPQISRKNWSSLSFMASLGVYRALSQIIDDIHKQSYGLKWPNDILCNDRKLAGLLLEANEKGVVIGCGVNLKNAPKLKGSSHSPIALDELMSGELMSGELIDADNLAGLIIVQIAELYALWQSGGQQIIFDEWRSCCDMKGKAVRIQTVTKLIEGVCEGIDADGQLCVRQSDGLRTKISAGDVEIMRDRNASGD